jgi:hypothetical protein
MVLPYLLRLLDLLRQFRFVRIDSTQSKGDRSIFLSARAQSRTRKNEYKRVFKPKKRFLQV